ncbi:MFS transporter small subunit [Acidocella sp.]|jgi:hypothetical protein
MQTDTTPVKLTIYWAIVLVPLAWGVYHTLLNALKLFG